MKSTTLFPIDTPVKNQEQPKRKYQQSKQAKQRYNLSHRARKAGATVNAKTRSFDANTLKHADALTRRRINKLMKLGFGGELKINFPE